MLQLIKNWLEGPKEYFTGVVIYKKLPGCSQRIIELFSKGPTNFSRQKLHESLTAAYIHLNAEDILSSEDAGLKVRSITIKQCEPVDPPAPALITTAPAIPNPELYEACKKDADMLYKEIMNLRAELFALGRSNDFDDPNRPDRIEGRRRLAINVVTGFQEVSALYDRAEYVKVNGRLPDQAADDPEDEIDLLPDIMVKPTLDNLRKNYNKIKNRPETAERVVLLQKHAANIKKLEDRWRSLKPKK